MPGRGPVEQAVPLNGTVRRTVGEYLRGHLGPLVYRCVMEINRRALKGIDIETALRAPFN